MSVFSGNSEAAKLRFFREKISRIVYVLQGQ